MCFFEQEQASSGHQSWNKAGGGERHWEAEVGGRGLCTNREHLGVSELHVLEADGLQRRKADGLG